MNTAKENLSLMEDLFAKDNCPVPLGFTDQDVNPKALRLFSDTFVLAYLKNMSIIAMAASGVTLGIATRPDVIFFKKRILNAAMTLQDQTRDLMLKQGTHVKPGY